MTMDLRSHSNSLDILCQGIGDEMKDLLKGDLKNISRESNEELFMDIFSVLCPTYPRAEIVEAYEIIKGNWLLLKEALSGPGTSAVVAEEIAGGEGNELETTVYVCGINPYKETMVLKSKTGYTLATIKDAIHRQNKRTLPLLMGRGDFHTVFSDEGRQTLLYKFSEYSGCRNTTSTCHKNLPNIDRKSMVSIPKRNLGVGLEYMFLPSMSDVAVDSTVSGAMAGNIETDDGFFPPEVNEMLMEARIEKIENERRPKLITALNNAFPCFTFEEWGNVMGHFCQFTGGGDIMVKSKSGVYGCIMFSNQIRAATLELKYTLKCRDLELQLQASMLLMAASLLNQQLKTGQVVDNILVYGLAFGVYHKLILLRLDIDFTTTVKFKNVFVSGPGLEYHLAIDSALAYMMTMLSQP